MTTQQTLTDNEIRWLGHLAQYHEIKAHDLDSISLEGEGFNEQINYLHDEKGINYDRLCLLMGHFIPIMNQLTAIEPYDGDLPDAIQDFIENTSLV